MPVFIDETLPDTILFLDIDGVLNSQQFRLEPVIIDLSDEAISDGAEMGIDRKALERLERICTELDAGIVITSTWRDTFSEIEFIEMFEKRGWPNAPVLGVTTNLQAVGGIRGDEVRLWIERNGFTGKHLCIDDKNEFHQGQRVFLTNYAHGLREEDVDVIIRTVKEQTNVEIPIEKNISAD